MTEFDDCWMETTIQASMVLLTTLGVPPLIRCDRDPRLVGNVQDAFPAPFLRFWAALGVTVEPCPPHRPDKKPSVERDHKALKQECLRPLHPTTVADAQAALDAWRDTYIRERPHQGTACHNQPPVVVFPDLPAWPPLPTTVNPDAWVTTLVNAIFVRRVNTNGSIHLGGYLYSISRALAGIDVVVQIDVERHEVVILHHEREYRRRPLKGIVGSPMALADYVQVLCAESRAVDRRIHERQHRSRRSRVR